MKKNGKKILFTVLFLAILVAICVVCLIIGRGHTLYFDNVTTDDEAHKYYQSVKVYYNDEKVASMGPRERSSVSFTGQTVTVTLEYEKKAGSMSEEVTYTFEVPYSMDKIMINLPALLDGEDESVYMSEFQGMGVADELMEDEEETTTEDDGTGAISE